MFFPEDEVKYGKPDPEKMCGDQVLVATEGTGFVEFRGLPDGTLQEGDRALIPSGIWHRHGAAEEGTLVHIAVTMGETEWDRDDACNKRV